ncbi:MAG: trypsin-like peptidase domain-containing protein [Bacillota bacterium]
MQSKPARMILFIAVTAFVAGIMFAGGCIMAGDLADSKSSGALARAEDSVSMPGVGPDTIANIVEQAGPAVVKIDTVKVRQGSSIDPLWNDPFFRNFFGSPYPFENRQREERGMGSGFIITGDGYILTNEHVISGATDIQVTVQGYDEPLQANVVGADYDLDLAVLKISSNKEFDHLNLGSSDRIKVGNWVIAIGNPYGLDHTVTIGVISAKGRPVAVEHRSYKNLLQTDASINPGNSGGPLLNLKGEVIGINTAVAQAQGIGFAIPTSTVKQVLDDLMRKGKVIRPWLGVQMQNLTPEIAQYLGLPNNEGVLVVGVVPGSPAQKAGLRQGDVILKWGENKVKHTEEAVEAIRQSKIGQRVEAAVYREGRTVKVVITVDERPAQL